MLREKLKVLTEGLERIPELWPYLGLNTGGKTRVLRSFPDKELKVRTIAIGDYFSQGALKPLHSYLFRVLKRIPQDCTFDQGGF